MNDSLWLAWSADPTALIGIPLAAILYARGLRSLERRRIHDRRRTASFYIGLIALFIALVSPLDALSDELFLAHMGQHMLLMFFAVPAIQIGAPVIPLMRGIPRPLRSVSPFPYSSLRWCEARCATSSAPSSRGRSSSASSWVGTSLLPTRLRSRMRPFT